MEAIHGSMLLVYAVIAIALLILLITRYKVYPFLVLIIVSLLLGLASGMPMATIVKSFETGNGNTLGHIAIVVGLGTMLGKMMAESGGAERIATTLIDVFGEKNIHWAMMVVAIIVGLPVFFEVGFVLLIPIAFNVAKRTNKSLLLVGLPMVAGLSVVHGLIPPHPAAMLAVQAYHADIGKTIVYGLIVGIPTCDRRGSAVRVADQPLYQAAERKSRSPRNFSCRNAAEGDATKAGAQKAAPKRELPSFGITLFTVLLPVILMLIGSWADLVFTPKTLPNDLLRFIGNSDVALLIAVLVSFWTFGASRGFNREQIQKFCGECLAPIAGITLIVGAGGGFGRVLMDSGISKEIVNVATSAHLSPLLFGWLCGCADPSRDWFGHGRHDDRLRHRRADRVGGAMQVRPELLVLATGSGSLIFSHVNDGGFWLIKEYFGMTVGQTFKTWSLLETIISLMGLGLTFALATVV